MLFLAIDFYIRVLKLLVTETFRVTNLCLVFWSQSLLNTAKQGKAFSNKGKTFQHSNIT